MYKFIMVVNICSEVEVIMDKIDNCGDDAKRVIILYSSE